MPSLLAAVPASVLGSDALWYSNVARQRRNYGGAALDSFAEFLALPDAQRRRLDNALSALPISGHAGTPIGQTFNWRGIVGFDFWQVERMIYAGPHADFATYSHLLGRLDATAIGQGLRAIGYRGRPYRAETILDSEDMIATTLAAGAASDFAIQTASVVAFPGVLIASRIPGGTAAALDSAAGATPDLAKDPNFRAAGSALGTSVGLGIFPSAKLYRAAAPSTIATPTASIQPYATALPEYRLAGFGLQDDGTSRTFLLALIYETASDANAALPILRQRLNDYTLDARLTRGERPLLRDRFTIGTGSVAVMNERAVVLQPLPIIAEADARLWLTMLLIGDTGFLRER